MNLQHVNLKLFIANPEAVDLADYHGIFNAWIQNHRTEELLVDVADYQHVHHGPGVILIGHEANYSLDNTGGRLGLLYNRKAALDGASLEKLEQAARAALAAARILEAENGVQFVGGELQLIVNDRLLAPNTLETFAALEADLKAFLDRLYQGFSYELSQRPDPRERFIVNVRAGAAFEIAALQRNLGVEPAHA
jgi:hypothetical protein